MSTYVLVHGAWHGGWCWERVVPGLHAAGHDVHAPTLTGLSERAHLLSPAVGLETHVEDVVRLLDVLDLRDVVLVGHSYAGQVVSGVVARRPEIIARRVHLDAFVGDEGERACDLLPPETAAHWAHAAEQDGFGWLVPVRPLTALGVHRPSDLDWLTPRLTPHPWKTYTDRLGPPGKAADVPAAFVECVGWSRVFARHAERARARGWPVHEIETGHEAMVTAPIELTEVLLALA